MSELFVGLMSGTSVDAIDAVLMDFSKSNTHILSSYSQSIPKKLRSEINVLIDACQHPKNFSSIDKQFAETSFEAVKQLLKQANVSADNVIAIGSHGQTVFHDPKGVPPVSIQIGSPQIIASLSKIPTVGNLRQADIDAGGEGAPLASAYHAETLQSINEERVVLNLGGIANITKLPSKKDEPIIGFDTGPANTLMDSWAQKHLSQPFDQDGDWARSGSIDSELLELMLKDKYFSMMPPKSTGREHFNHEWIQHYINDYNTAIAPENIQATLLALTTHTITDSMEMWCPQTKKVLLCGGGSENKYLVEQLQNKLEGIPIQKTSDYEVPSKWMEAMAFAWLAKQRIENKVGNIPSVTGANKPVILGEYFAPI